MRDVIKSTWFDSSLRGFGCKDREPVREKKLREAEREKKMRGRGR